MHELSIAMGIVKIAEQETRKAKAKEVELIELEIGALSGIQIDSLNFAWPLAIKNSVLENAEKKIDLIKGIARCPECETIYNIENLFDSCPKCNSYFKDIIKGKELRVKAITVKK